jgi:hypothetical protein
VPLGEAPRYTGHMVVNRNRKRPDSGWDIIPYEFSPMTDISL